MWIKAAAFLCQKGDLSSMQLPTVSYAKTWMKYSCIFTLTGRGGSHGHDNSVWILRLEFRKRFKCCCIFVLTGADACQWADKTGDSRKQLASLLEGYADALQLWFCPACSLSCRSPTAWSCVLQDTTKTWRFGDYHYDWSTTPDDSLSPGRSCRNRKGSWHHHLHAGPFLPVLWI